VFMWGEGSGLVDKGFIPARPFLYSFLLAQEVGEKGFLLNECSHCIVQSLILATVSSGLLLLL
jgi:hypothetical protein